MSGTYENINFRESVTPSFSKDKHNESKVELAKILKAGLKKPAVSKEDNYKRITDAFKNLNSIK